MSVFNIGLAIWLEASYQAWIFNAQNSFERALTRETWLRHVR